MSKYTTELRYICETKSGLKVSLGDNDVERVIADSRAEIFNFNYPIFDENYRPTLECKILQHFYTREIGSETYGLWHMRLRSKMQEIMPYYNKLYESELLEFNPLDDVGWYEDTMGNKSANESETGEGQSAKQSAVNDSGSHSTNTQSAKTDTDHSIDRFHDTPQGFINDLSTSNYLTNVRTVDSNGTDNATINETGTNQRITNGSQNESNNYERANAKQIAETETKHIHGKMHGKSYNELLKEFRNNMLNIDMKIIAELEELFIQLW